MKKKRKVYLPPGGVWYWAYGSNLSGEQMRSRCPRAIRFKDLSLAYGRLVFRGVADCQLTDNENDVIHGGLWYISKRCEEVLDRFEGISSKFYVKRWIKLKIQGEPVNAFFYKMNEEYVGEDGIMPPGPAYLDKIVRGYREFNLPLEALDNALAESWDRKNITPVLAQRKTRRGDKLARRIRNLAN
jgi:gamma-glutamylcyclotransferase (GGCT)/AIG2-like uncharacterized protein YtfP